MNAATSSGDIERANDPRAASCSLRSAASSAARRPSLALAMIGSGVPFGANTASQLEAIRSDFTLSGIKRDSQTARTVIPVLSSCRGGRQDGVATGANVFGGSEGEGTGGGGPWRQGL